ncbi:MAG: hypothetical protein WA667_27095 [Candidatus Nitrosopolaris sp.]
MKHTFSVYQFITMLMFPFTLLLGTLVGIIIIAMMPEMVYSRVCLNHGSTPLITRHENTGGLFHVNNKGVNGQAKLCAGQIAGLLPNSISHIV